MFLFWVRSSGTDTGVSPKSKIVTYQQFSIQESGSGSLGQQASEKSRTVLIANVMASGGDECYAAKRILVKNLPPSISRDKLEIYFQRGKNGGNGDVLSVTFWVSELDARTTQAVIEFQSDKSK